MPILGLRDDLIEFNRNARVSGEDFMSSNDPLLAPIVGGQCRTIGGAQIDVVRTGACRVKRVIYPPGFRWATHMKAIVGTDLCMHAHVGFLFRGQVHIQYADGCTLEFAALRPSPSSRDTTGGSWADEGRSAD